MYVIDVHTLEYISKQLNRYLAIVIFVFGVVGNILNCCILSQRALRSNPCAQLFLVSSFIGLISILIGLPTRILSGWDLDPTTTNNSICKFRAFTVFSTRTMAIWLIMLATLDRWLVSSTSFHRRQMSTSRNVKRGLCTTIVLSVLFYAQMLYCYEANIRNAPLKCYGKSIGCCFATDLIYALITIVLPAILMSIFSLMIISNIHRLHVRRQTMTVVSLVIPSRIGDLKLKRTDQQLLRMLFVQVFLLVIFCVPQAIQKFYTTFRPFGSVSRQEDAINHFLYNIEVLLAFIANGMPFYLYTLSGGILFRKASVDFLRSIERKVKCWT